jgi:hypothetical protein
MRQSKLSYLLEYLNILLDDTSDTPHPPAEKIQYCSIVLDQDSHRKLLHWWENEIGALLPISVAHHMTIVFRPSETELAEIPFGKHVRLVINGWAEDDKIQAVRVISSIPLLAGNGSGKGKIPHITVATAPGAFAARSNDVIGHAVSKRGPELSGIVSFELRR